MNRKYGLRVYLSGGLGNQLFQWSFGHFLSQKTGTAIKIIKFPVRAQIAHANLNLSDYFPFCDHCSFGKISTPMFINQFLDPWNSKFRNLRRERLADFRSDPFMLHSNIEINSRFGYLGYFQNVDFVHEVQNTVRFEIKSVLEPQTQQLRNLPKKLPLEIIHVRRGDTLTLANQARVGVLDVDYYLSLIRPKSTNMYRIIVTDDVHGAQSVITKIKPDKILGPESLDVLNTLALMSRATRLVMANSTLSWWGGFLALSNGAEIVAPKPFFKSQDLHSGDALDYPGFVTAESVFI